MDFEYTVTKKLTEGDIEDILTTALEGGIGYWACLWNGDPDWERAEAIVEAEGKKSYYCTVFWKVLQMGKVVKFSDADYDCDDPEADIWYYGMEQFKKSCELYEQERGSLRKCLDDGSFDAIEADIFIQLGLFGEIVFG